MTAGHMAGCFSAAVVYADISMISAKVIPPVTVKRNILSGYTYQPDQSEALILHQKQNRMRGKDRDRPMKKATICDAGMNPLPQMALQERLPYTTWRKENQSPLCRRITDKFSESFNRLT